MQGCAGNFKRADRFARLFGNCLRNVCPHAAENSYDTSARRVESDFTQRELGSGMSGRCDQPEGGTGNIAGNDKVAGARKLAALHRNPVPRPADRNSERLQHPLGVIARGDRLDNGCFAVREQAGQENTTLHLRAGYRKAIFDALQIGASIDDKRRTIALTLGAEFCPH